LCKIAEDSENDTHASPLKQPTKLVKSKWKGEDEEGDSPVVCYIDSFIDDSILICDLCRATGKHPLMKKIKLRHLLH
jgi:hypothetical protein